MYCRIFIVYILLMVSYCSFSRKTFIWWYVEKGYTFPISVWKTIAGKNYYFGKNGYLFVECHIKSAVNNAYYWVDNDGVWLEQYNTTAPDPGYRVVEDYTTENAYQGYSLIQSGK